MITIIYWARLRRNTGSGKSIPDLDSQAINYWLHFVAQYADIGHESAPNRVRFGPGPVPGQHPVLGDGVGGLRQIGADLRYDPSGLALV